MATLEGITIEQPVTDILQIWEPSRIAVYLRTKSALHSSTYDEVVCSTCATLNIPYNKSRLLAMQKWPKLTVLVFDVFYDDFDASTGHHRVDFPVLHVDYGRKHSYARVASSKLRKIINDHVATQHNYHGWDSRPPYFEDQTGAAPPKYENPRDISLLSATT